jgi:hypothetical protein
MKSLRALLPILLLFALWVATGCTPAQLTDAEFASQVMQAVVDKGYIHDNASKPMPPYQEDGLTIYFSWIDSDWTDGQAAAQLSVIFEAFELDGSTIDGGFTVDVALSFDGDKPTSLTGVFNTISEPVPEPLVVTGKHAGQYEFADATVVYDFATHGYTFGGAVIVDGVTHDL